MPESYVEIINSRKFKLAGTLSVPKSKGTYPAVLFLHGFLSSRTRKKITTIMDMLKDDAILLAIDFTGHGQSEGHIKNITLSTCIDDATCALSFLKSLPQTDTKRIGLYGSSLGGATAIHVASKDKSLRALVLIAPVGDFKDLHTHRFTAASLRKWKQQDYLLEKDASGKAVRVNYSFVTDARRYDGFLAAKKIRAKTLICHGDRDDVVPYEQGKRVFEAAREPKEFYTIRGAHHNDTYIAGGDAYFAALKDFVARAASRLPAASGQRNAL